MIDIQKIKKGTPFILLPDFFSEKMPLKVFFLFTTKGFIQNYLSAQLIVTDNSENIDKYQDLEDFKSLHIYPLFEAKGVIPIDDINDLKPYNEKLFKKYNEVFKYIIENEKIETMSNELYRLQNIETRYELFLQIEKFKNEQKILLEQISSGNKDLADSLKILEKKINDLEKLIQGNGAE